MAAAFHPLFDSQRLLRKSKIADSVWKPVPEARNVIAQNGALLLGGVLGRWEKSECRRHGTFGRWYIPAAGEKYKLRRGVGGKPPVLCLHFVVICERHVKMPPAKATQNLVPE